MTYPEETFLECQTCGEPVKRISDLMRRRLAQDPQNFIVWCSLRCRHEDPQNLDRSWR